MPVKIKKVLKHSLAEEMNIQTGDILLEINDHSINDNLDYIFYQTEEELKLIILRGIQKFTHFIEKKLDEDIGLELESIKVRGCVCNCIFCFVDQIHPDARPSLKVKDDDFRLSFVHGNFITLANMQKKDYDRIIEQHLSPLYISVHTTDDGLRKKIMRCKSNFSIMERLFYLAENGISIHTQIVLIPGWNDGRELEKTVLNLSSLFPSVQSIGIVPVGLTKFRMKLTSLRKVTKEEAKELIKQTNVWRTQFMEIYGSGLVSLADEFYLLADEPIPQVEYYDEFPQIENGIGMVRNFLDNWDDYSIELLGKYSGNKVVFVTGFAFYPVLNELVKKINNKQNQKWRVLQVENEFLGKDVTVAGLLAGCDVKKALEDKDYDVALLPDEMFNMDGITLDGLTIQQILSY